MHAHNTHNQKTHWKTAFIHNKNRIDQWLAVLITRCKAHNEPTAKHAPSTFQLSTIGTDAMFITLSSVFIWSNESHRGLRKTQRIQNNTRLFL